MIIAKSLVIQEQIDLHLRFSRTGQIQLPSTPPPLLLAHTHLLLMPRLPIRLGHQRLPRIPDALATLEILRPVHEPPLRVLAPVDEIRVVERELDGAVDDGVGGLDAQHEGVVLVADFVAPAAEAAAREDVLFLQFGEELLEDALALEGRGRVAVVEAAVVGGDEFVGGLEHLRGDEAADGVLEEGGVVDGFHGGFRDFEHDGPVRALALLGRGGFAAVGEALGGELHVVVGLVVGRVVGEDGGAVEGAVVFGEVEPALVADAFWARAPDADANDVRGAVEQVFGEGNERRIADLLRERVNSHGVD